MQVQSCHIIQPISAASPAKSSLPANKVSLPVKTPRAISITAPSDLVSTPDVIDHDDSTAAFRDYQSLWVSQRSETAAPVTLRVVDGAIPADFPPGTYYLTGPGLFTDDHGSTVHPLDGHGYLRTFTIDGAKGEVKFMARYIETEAQVEERDPETGRWRFTHRGPFSVLKGGKMVGNTKVMKNVANTSVVRWGGRLLCLWEGGEPYEIESRTLETLGKVDVINGGRDPSASGGGLKADVWDVAAAMLKPILYGVFNMPPQRFLSHYKIDARRNRLMILSCNAEDMLLPRSHFTFYVNPSKPTSPIYLLPRFPAPVDHHHDQSSRDEIRDWRVPIEAPSQMWVLHVGNAFEETTRDHENGNSSSEIQIQASGCSYRWFNFQKLFGYDWQSGKLDPAMMNLNQGKEKLLPHLVQVSINLDSNGNCENCTVKPLNQWSKAADFPVINHEYSGRQNTFIYAATSSGSRQALPHFPFDTVVKLNTLDESTRTWSVGTRRFVGEPIFVPGSGTQEDDGYILVVEYAVATRRCYLVILDSKRIGEADALVARLQVPKNLNFPLGFHGFWSPS
ncbi:hypothetical protein C3L33_22186, partial [Rhododendron williamsianum]